MDQLLSRKDIFYLSEKLLDWQKKYDKHYVYLNINFGISAIIHIRFIISWYSNLDITISDATTKEELQYIINILEGILQEDIHNIKTYPDYKHFIKTIKFIIKILNKVLGGKYGVCSRAKS